MQGMDFVQVPFRLLTPTARMPRYSTAGSSGLDLHLSEAVSLIPGSVYTLSTGVAVAIPPGYEAQIRPRSGLARRGFIVYVGTIDSDYRGELGVLCSTFAPITFEVGDRIAQLVIAPVAQAELLKVEAFDATERGCGGFGHTGI